MSADQLVDILAEDQVADLRPGFNGIGLLHLASVPESDASISGATATGQEPMLMGRPCDGFDCGQMASEFADGLILVMN